MLIFEEYCSQFKIADILSYLDGYPLLLPCRYFNWQYTNVIQESRAAFLRRIHQVREYQNGSVLEYDSISKYMPHPSFVPMESNEVPPWENDE